MSEYGPKYAHFRMGGYVSNSTGENAPRSGRRDYFLNRTAKHQRYKGAIWPSFRSARERELGTHEFGPPYVRES